MTVKSILAIDRQEALDATARQGSRDLRMRVRKLAKQKIGECEALVKLDALLNRSWRATDSRNEYVHNLWAHDTAGNPVISDDEHAMQPIPTLQELDTLANELAQIAAELNYARRTGFLFEALKAAKVTIP